MPSISHSLLSLAAFLGASTLASARSLPTRGSLVPRQSAPGSPGFTPGFECHLPDGWEWCYTETKRDCWMRKKDGTKEFNIKSDYEREAPEGIERPYDLTIDEKTIAPDSIDKVAQLINEKYPGTLLEACWGDTFVINVKNNLKNNGTTMHWHGVRQLNSNHMDGVNGVTQCPISEGDTFQYKFKTTQYGHTWYHSHYSSQYSEGVAGPMLVHGPHSDSWDFEWEPLMITDWVHQSAYTEFRKEITTGQGLPMADSILVNGTGRYKGAGEYFRAHKFQPGKKYLIRIINASTGFHFDWSIDGHDFKVVSTDFVPVKPYTANRISVAIGQRYSVIVEAKQNPDSENKLYWMRTEYTTTGGCNTEFRDKNAITTTTGIISYEGSTGDLPTTTKNDGTVACNDPPLASVTPIVRWDISNPGQNQDKLLDNTFEAGLNLATRFHNNATRWALTDTPLWLNFSDPVLLHLNNNNQTFDAEYGIVNYDYDDPERWVYLVVTSGDIAAKGGAPKAVGGAHPIHLHGHDFAVIGQSGTKYDPATSPATFKFDNPIRRDVAMLPNGGYLAIAFKPDNPGAWILHCHIAWHAGSGLALNILERQSKIKDIVGDLPAVRDGCNKWDSWLAKDTGNSQKFDPHHQEDSGI